jgi:hypothetical protein
MEEKRKSKRLHIGKITSLFFFASAGEIIESIAKKSITAE